MKSPSKDTQHYILIALLVIFCGVYFRIYPATQNLTAQNIDIARLMVYANLRKVLTQNIENVYPNIPAEEKDSLINLQLKKLAETESANIDKTAREILKTSGNPIPKTYLLEADPYFYYYQTNKLLHEGRLSDQQKDGQYLDRFMMAPTGFWRGIVIHPYIGLFVYKLTSIFNKNVSLMTTSAYVPLLFFAIAIGVFVMICRLLEIPKFITAISALFFCLSPIFIQRSSFGWYKTDPYNVIFLLLLVFTFCKIPKDGRTGYGWLLALILLNGIYALFWEGWLLLPGLTILVFLSTITYKAIRRQSFLPDLKRLSLFVVAFPVAVSLCISPGGLIHSFQDIGDIFSKFLLFNTSLWPDIFITVGELEKPSFERLTQILGGWVFVLISIVGIFVLLLDKSSKRKIEEKISIGVILIFLYAMAKSAERFILFLLIPAAICFAIGLNKIFVLLKRLFNNVLKIKPPVLAAVPSYGLICLLLISPLIYAQASASNQNPIFNMVWEQALNQIRLQTPKDSIINSWWCPGHFIKAIAERRVTFDGATMNTPQAFWMSAFFLSDNEKEAVGILRMLNSSGNEASEYLLKESLSLQETVALIKKIVVLNKSEALSLARKELPDKVAQHLISLTHGSPPSSYCLVYNDLIDGVLGLYYVKNWDFKKASEIAQERNCEFKKGNFFWRGSSDNIATIWSIAGGNTYIGPESAETARAEDFVYFANGSSLNLSTMQARLNNFDKNFSGVLQSTVYLEDGQITEKDFPDADLKLSMLLIKNADGHYSSIIAPPDVLKSVLFRLYYFDGAGLNKFQKFTSVDNPILNTKILVYKVNWN